MKVKTLSRPVGEKGIRKIYGLKISDLPKSGKQKLRREWIARFKNFITQNATAITIHTVDGDIVFYIDHDPGRYCLTCNEKLPETRDDPYNKKAHAHVATHGNTADKSNCWPHGYMVANSFECTIEDKRNG